MATKRPLIAFVTASILLLLSCLSVIVIRHDEDGSVGSNFGNATTAPTETVAAAATETRRAPAPTTSREKPMNKVIRLDLRTTSSLIAERRRQRRRLLHHSTNATRGMEYDWSDSFEEQFKYNYNYYISHRHLSRFERQLRTVLDIDLYPNWHGNYSDEQDIGAWNIQQNLQTLLSSTSSNNYTNGADGPNRRKLLQSLLGGTFDRYQGVPLSQGFGTHYVHLWVGSPIPQRQSVIVDTGSHFTGFPVKGCQGCGENHHTDPHFDPSKSETFHALKCPKECLEHYTCDYHPFETTTTKKTTTPGATTRSARKDQHHQSTNSSDPYPHRKLHRRHNDLESDGPELSSRYLSNGVPAEGRNIVARCKFKQAYTEGSSWVAYQARDTVYCGGGDNLLDAVDESDTSYAIPFVFGCLQENSGLFITQLADGIMGMSAHELTLPKQLYNAGKLEYNMFAMCFRKETGTSKRGVTAGSMTLGGVSSTLDTSPMVYARNTVTHGWFTPYIQNIYVARNGGDRFLFDTHESTRNIVKLPMNDKMLNVGRGVIVDSGTTDTYINSIIQPAFVKIWKQVTGMEYTHGPVYLTQAQLKRLPTLLIQMQAATNVEKASVVASYEVSSSTFSQNRHSATKGNPYIRPVIGQVGYLDPQRWNDVLLSIPATRYMEYSPTLGVYTSRLFFTESRGAVLGANAMQEHNVLFDWHHGRIGFAHSSCEYDLIAGQNDNHANFVSSDSYHDCILAVDRPILTQACVENVDIAICEASDNPTNVDIGGTEIWTLLVESAGEVGSCERAMQEWVEAQQTVRQIDPSITNCTLDGVCHEYRPCHIPCMDAIKYHEKKKRQKKVSTDSVTIPHRTVSRTKAANVLLQGGLSDDSSMAYSCKGWMWSACDHSCQQTRISTITVIEHQNGHYCIEETRDRRSCHVDACGRSDPCTVPFLVHAIFVLEGTYGANSWTPTVQDFFLKELTHAVHSNSGISSMNKDGTPHFGEGDIKILATRPWYGDDDEDNDNLEEDNAESLLSEFSEHNEDDGQLGIQLILQISISNPSAHRRFGQENLGTSRKLLQEVGVIWSNFTQVFRDPQHVCDPIELYPLAKVANDIATNILPHPSFTARLVDRIEALENVRLISSWTIGTQVYDDSINFLGPLASTPFFLLIRFIHQVFILTVVGWTGMYLFALFHRWKGFFCVRFSRKCWLIGCDLMKDNDCHTCDVEDASALLERDTFSGRNVALNHRVKEIEMTSPARYTSSNGMKRRNSTPIESALNIKIV